MKMRKVYLVTVFLTLVIMLALESRPQTLDAREKTEEIARLFSKSKNKVKEKHNIRIEISVDIKSEPFLRQSVAEYSGNHKSDTDNWFELKVGADGKIEAEGTEPAPQGARRFTLKNARIDGALLTGTKVYEDGESENFEAAFLKRTVRLNQSDLGITVFGWGVRYDQPKTIADGAFTINKLFYELK